MGFEETKTKNVHLQTPQLFTVSFSGIDGAGKTTQIENLTRWLGQAAIEVQVIRFWDDIASLRGLREWLGHKLFKGDKGIGTPERPVERRDKNVRNWYMPVVRLFLCSVDAIALAIVIARIRIQRPADVIIFDRYLYDQLANLNLQSPIVRVLVQVMRRLIPRPDVPCLLDADPELARLRKPEYPADFLRQNRQSYLRLAELAGMDEIPAGSADEVTANVRRIVVSRMRPSQDYSLEYSSTSKH
jgi:thymidylate kinase